MWISRRRVVILAAVLLLAGYALLTSSVTESIVFSYVASPVTESPPEEESMANEDPETAIMRAAAITSPDGESGASDSGEVDAEAASGETSVTDGKSSASEAEADAESSPEISAPKTSKGPSPSSKWSPSKDPSPSSKWSPSKIARASSSPSKPATIEAPPVKKEEPKTPPTPKEKPATSQKSGEDSLAEQREELRRLLQREKELKELLEKRKASGDGSDAADSERDVKRKAPTFKKGPVSKDLRTTYSCQTYGAWSEYCVYENLCFNVTMLKENSTIFLVEPEKAWQQQRRNVRDRRKFIMKPSTKLPKTIAKHPEYGGGPLQVWGGFHAIYVDRLDGVLGETVNWLDHLWLLDPMVPIGNIWYVSTFVGPLYFARYYNDTLQLPGMETVYWNKPQEKYTNDWIQNVLSIAVGKSLEAMTSVVKFSDAEDFFSDPSQDAVCVRKAVLPGREPFMFSSIESAHAFRAETYASLGIELLPRPTERRVVFLDRNYYRSRYMVNIEDLYDIAKKYGFEYEQAIFSAPPTFEEQVQVLSRASILACVHGAGLANVVFLQPKSAVIEIFPYFMRHDLYERMSHYAGVYHYQVLVRNMTDGEGVWGEAASMKVWDQTHCETYPSMEMPESSCYHVLKNQYVRTPVDLFEREFVRAASHVGFTDVWDTYFAGKQNEFLEQKPFIWNDSNP